MTTPENTTTDHTRDNSTAKQAPGPNARHIRIVGYTVALVALLADLTTKWWALNALADGRRMQVVGDYLTFVLLYNSGAAFSLGDNATIFFTILAAIFSIILIIAIWRARDLKASILYALLLGGAMGNLYDRLFSPPGFGHGHVVDFINYNGYFVGNVADIWIVLAVLLLILYSFRQGENE